MRTAEIRRGGKKKEKPIFTFDHVLQGLVELLQEWRDIQVGGHVEEEVVLVHAVADAVAFPGNRPKSAEHDGRRREGGGRENVGVEQLVGYSQRGGGGKQKESNQREEDILFFGCGKLYKPLSLKISGTSPCFWPMLLRANK